MAGVGVAPHAPPNMLQPMDEMILPPKRQAVVDRLRRRIETYRRRQSECVPRFDQSFTGACEQENLQTSVLQKKFLEGKAKRQPKKAERKPDLPAISGNLHSSVHVQQKFGCGDYEPPAKLQCVGGAGGGQEGLTKFSVEIVQQLEFTTSAADSQPQQISTNVTVKALANAIKTSNSPPPPRVPTPLDCERECKAELKSETPEDDFGLDECAAALERDAAFPGLADLIGEEESDEITSAAIEDLITDLSEYPEFMKDFDLDGGRMGNESEGVGYGGAGSLSPAAQTLKQMAEQHQAAAGEWARYRTYPGYRPRAPPPPDHIHMSQAQQLHLSQPHHNLQVSAGQHMQVSGEARGHVSASAHQSMFASYSHPSHPAHHSPHHPHQGAGGCDSYSMSQSQTLSFSQQGLRQRPSPPGPPQQPGPMGVAAAGLSREQQAKMLQAQQQQMLRAQHQLRPPPPDYKACGARYGPGSAAPGAGTGAVPAGMGAARRPRPYPPPQRPYSPEWRHLLMQQHHAALRHPFPHHSQGGFGVSGGVGGVPGGVGGNVGGVGGVGAGGLSAQQMQQLQHHQIRMHQHQQLLHHQRGQNQQSPISHIAMQQNQMLNAQGQMSNIHMSQSQSLSMQQGNMSSSMPGPTHQGSPMQGQNGPMSGQNGPMSGQSGQMSGQNGPMSAPSPMQAQSPMQGHSPMQCQSPMQGQNGPIQGQNGPMQGQNGPMQGQNGPMQGQNGPMQGQNGPMQSQNGQMQSQSVSMSQSAQIGNVQNGNNGGFPSLHNASSFPAHTADFNLDFLDNMPSADGNNMTAQELLNSLDNSFLNDIL